MSHLAHSSIPSTEPDRERHRIAVLKRYDIIDTPPEVAFDRITALAADLFDAPIAIVSFLDGQRLWFKSHHGLDSTEVRWRKDASISTMETLIRGEFGVGFFVSAPLITHDGHELGALCVIDHQPRAIDQRQLRNLATLAALVIDRMELRRTARTAAARAEILAAEIDHRAMNSLQLVASLLNLQSRITRVPETAQQLTIASNRVQAVARIHRNFSVSESVEQVPVVAYLRRLCGELADVLGVAIEVEGTEANVPTRQLLPIGLVVNELATNAQKHGAGPITITFAPCAADRYELRVCDQGGGLPEGFDVGRFTGNGLGIKVVTVLVQQLEGQLSAGANPACRGACFTITFPRKIPEIGTDLRHQG